MRQALSSQDLPEHIISILKNRDITTSAHKINEIKNISSSIDIPLYYSMSSVIKRLDSYNTDDTLTPEMMIDIMILWSMRPVEVATLRVRDMEDGTKAVIGYAKSKKQDTTPRKIMTFIDIDRAIKLLTWLHDSVEVNPKLNAGDPIVSTQLRKILKPHHLKLKDLRVLGSYYSANANVIDKSNTNAAEITANTRTALRHSETLPRSSVEYYQKIRTSVA